MTRENPCPGKTFGYLSALESAEHGFFGGYLLVSLLGRPLEFHCTAPVKPSRAQQILYGQTLHPYLLGEQIGGSLVREATLKPAVILTDQTAVLYLRSQIEVPVAHMVRLPDSIGNATAIESDDTYCSRSDASRSCPAHVGDGSLQFDLYGYQCGVAPGYELDRDVVVRLLTELAQHVELDEPFGRIHDAINEAQRIGGGGQDIHGQAA